MTFHVPLMEGSAYRVTEFHDARASLRVMFFFVSVQTLTMVWLRLSESDIGFTSPLDFLYDVFDSVQII